MQGEEGLFIINEIREEEVMKKYCSRLDLLRFLAALVVAFFFHYIIVFGDSPVGGNIIGDALNKYGGYVVELFYVVSGFVMYIAYAERIREGQTYFTKYITDRVVRLYPAMIISVVLTIIPMWLGYAFWDTAVASDSAVTLLAIFLNLLGLNGGTVSGYTFMTSVNGPSWYITVLLICYLVFYGIIKLCRGSKGAENVAFIFIIILGIFFYLNSMNIPMMFVCCTRGYVFFFIGVFLAQIYGRTNWIGNLIMCAISIIMIWMYFFASKHELFISDSLELGLFIVCPIVMLFIGFFPLEYICSNVVVKFLGGISFGIFLWNLPVFIWVRFVEKYMDESFDYGSITTYLLIVAINCTVGVLSYILIDKLLVNRIKNKL